MDEPEQVQETRTTLSLLYLRFLDEVRRIRTTYSQEGGEGEEYIVRDLRTCFKHSNSRIIDYFLEYGASAGYILRYRLNIAKRTVYDSLLDLRGMGLIQAKTTVKPFSKRKRPATIWAIPTATANQVLEAVKLYQKLTNPIYVHAEKLGSKFIAKWNPERESIEREDLMGFIIEEKVPGHMRNDVFNWIAEILKAEGFKVWK